MNCILLPKLTRDQTEFTLNNQKQVDHILKVLKLNVGDTLKVGCLAGNIGTARIADIYDSASIMENNRRTEQAQQIRLADIQCTLMPPPKLDLTLVLALPRPKVLRRLIMDMTAIGVAEIILVNSYRTDKSYWQSPMLKRIDEFILEGLQQGVDTVPPKLSCRKRLKPFVEDELNALTLAKRSVVAHPYAATTLEDYEAIHGLPQIICIGAEGGWIDYEVNLLRENGCDTINLGRRILRTEAVVNALCGRYL